MPQHPMPLPPGHSRAKNMRLSTIRPLITAIGLCLCTSSAAAQGGDNCSNPQVVSGGGPFAFDTGAATTDGYAESSASIPGLYDIYFDVWFSWTAPTSGAYVLSTCYPQTAFATAQAVYDYGCSTGPGRAQTARALNCGLWTELTFAAEAGVPVLIRIGSVNSVSAGPGQFTITQTSLPGVMGSAVYPGNGRTYHILEPSSWGVAQAAAVELGGNLVTVNDQAENDWLQQTFWSWGGQQRSFWIGYSDAETEGTWEWASGETPGYENWSGSPNNGNESEHYAHFRKDWADGTWNDLYGDPNAGFFYDEVHGVVELSLDVGTNYCIASINSTGFASSISAGGSASISANNLVLTADNLPSQPGIFIAGPTQAQTPFFNGFLCVAPQGLQRFGNVSAPVGGVITEAVDYATSAPGGLSVVAGQSYNYQRWNRDPAAGGAAANFSDGIEIVHTP